MEQNNIENQFRDKLNSREIKPSENSWDRLDAMLTVAEKPKKNDRWMFFAASFLGFILIATVFFSQTEEVIDSEHHKVVIQESKVEENENVLENGLEIPTQNNPVHIVSTSEKVEVQKQRKNSAKVNSNQFIQKELPTEIASISNKENKTSSIITREQSTNWRSDQKMEVKVNASSLLASVENNQVPISRNDAVGISVNTNELLSKVDGELELSFREKVIKSVNKTYREVKVAVIKRNLE